MATGTWANPAYGPPPDIVIRTSHPDQSREAAGFDDMIKLMQKQIELTERLLGERKSQKNSNGEISQEILTVLREMRETQVSAADITKKPIPSVPATSSSAWGPLLRSHLSHIQPTIDRWKGTLDTMLVFVRLAYPHFNGERGLDLNNIQIALFSAIIATFFVESLAGLVQDPASETNELLRNLTELLIVISGTDTAHLDIAPPTPFQPDGSAVRLNLYWSISLILSISVAALAVTSRGYIGMLSRSSHTPAHKRLGDLHRRWEQANRLLAPAIEILPQLLIIPVVLFVVGLLDNLISTTVPLSESFIPVFAAGIVSSLLAVTVGAYTTWTVLHGCWFAETSPFQSTLSVFCAVYGRNAIAFARRFFRAFYLHLGSCLKSIMGARVNATVWPVNEIPLTSPISPSGLADEMNMKSYRSSTSIEDHEYVAFHNTLQRIHEDDVLDQAVAAFSSLIEQRHSSQGSIQSPLQSMKYEISSLSYMLSDEASSRSNITAAGIISQSIRPWQSYGYKPQERLHLVPLLVKSAERYSFTVTGTRWSSILWDCPFASAMHKLVCSDPLSDAPERYHDSVIAQEVPIIGLLLADLTDLDKNTSHSPLGETVVPFLARVLHSHLQQYWEETKDLKSAMMRLIDAQSSETLSLVYKALAHSLNSDPDKTKAGSLKRISLVMTLGVSPGLLTHERRVLQSFVQWIISWSVMKGGTSVSDIIRGVDLVLDALSTELEKDTSGASATEKLDWLEFVLLQLRSSLTVKGIVGIQDQSQLEPITTLIIRIVYFLQRLDSDHNAWSHRLHNVEYNHDGKKCSSLCRFSATIIHFVLLIRRELPGNARLTTELWRPLASSLQVRSAELGAGSSARWHRDRVKAKIMVAFQTLAPEDEVPGNSTPRRVNHTRLSVNSTRPSSLSLSQGASPPLAMPPPLASRLTRPSVINVYQISPPTSNQSNIIPTEIAAGPSRASSPPFIPPQPNSTPFSGFIPMPWERRPAQSSDHTAQVSTPIPLPSASSAEYIPSPPRRSDALPALSTKQGPHPLERRPAQESDPTAYISTAFSSPSISADYIPSPPRRSNALPVSTMNQSPHSTLERAQVVATPQFMRDSNEPMNLPPPWVSSSLSDPMHAAPNQIPVRLSMMSSGRPYPGDISLYPSPYTRPSRAPVPLQPYHSSAYHFSPFYSPPDGSPDPDEDSLYFTPTYPQGPSIYTPPQVHENFFHPAPHDEPVPPSTPPASFQQHEATVLPTPTSMSTATSGAQQAHWSSPGPASPSSQPQSHLGLPPSESPRSSSPLFIPPLPDSRHQWADSVLNDHAESSAENSRPYHVEGPANYLVATSSRPGPAATPSPGAAPPKPNWRTYPGTNVGRPRAYALLSPSGAAEYAYDSRPPPTTTSTPQNGESPYGPSGDPMYSHSARSSNSITVRSRTRSPPHPGAYVITGMSQSARTTPVDISVVQASPSSAYAGAAPSSSTASITSELLAVRPTRPRARSMPGNILRSETVLPMVVSTTW